MRVDASICNIQSTDAMSINEGILCVGNDFTVCGGDTLTGAGTSYIDAASINDGNVLGTLHINKPSRAFGLTTGTVSSSVMFGAVACGLATDISEVVNWELYPNPVLDVITSPERHINY